MVPLAVTACSTRWELGRLWRRAGIGRGISAWAAVSFTAGWLTMAVGAGLARRVDVADAVLGPHDAAHAADARRGAAADVRSSAAGVDVGVQATTTRSGGTGIPRAARLAAGAPLTAPLAVFLLQAIALWVWHIRRWYEAALRHDGVHALEHLCFVLAARLFWWAMVHGRYGSGGYGLAVLYVFLTAVHSSASARLLTVSPSCGTASTEAGARVARRCARRSAARRPADVDPGRSDLHRFRPRAARRVAGRSRAAGALRRDRRRGARG